MNTLLGVSTALSLSPVYLYPIINLRCWNQLEEEVGGVGTATRGKVTDACSKNEVTQNFKHVSSKYE